MKIKKFILARLEERMLMALTAQTVAPKWTTRPSPAGDGYPFDIVADGYDENADLFITVNSDPESCSVDEDAAAHIAFHDPDFVLREIAAQRALVESQPSYRLSRGMPKIRFNDDGSMEVFRANKWQPFDRAEFRAKYTTPVVPTLTLRLLAAPYADHPDFDPKWLLSSLVQCAPVKDVKTMLARKAVDTLVNGMPKSVQS